MFPAAVTVSVVIVGTVGVALILSTPVALLVKAVTAPVPSILNVRLLVMVAEVIAPAPELLIIPLLIRVVIEQVPWIFSVPVALLMNTPVPPRAVEIVTVPLLITVPGEVIVRVAIVMALAPLKVTPVIRRKVCGPFTSHGPGQHA